MEASMKGIALALGLAGLVTTVAVGKQQSPAPLVVHEWGTITTRHAPNGTPEGRLNHIEPSASEVLPSFVHRYEPSATKDQPDKSLAKSSLTPGRPDVTMRLETPVIYFHVPPNASPPGPFDVDVRMRGGILNEFYPRGDGSVLVDVERVQQKMQAGVLPLTWDGDVLNNYVVGGLRWKGISLRDSISLPTTTSHVWLAPRQVRSKGVVAQSGESERYLFYRGVAHLDALVQTELIENDLVLRSPKRLLWLREPTATLSHLWVVDITQNGTAAFRDEAPLTISRDAASVELRRIPLFSEPDYGADKLGKLRASMKRALLAAGLYEDESEAMLETWKASYYHMPGLRVFYLVPQQWLEYFLPLQISAPNELKRVLVGRIDLERH
jgi:hypothetical protein